MDRTNKNFQGIAKNAYAFGGKNVADIIVWHEKIRISLNIYDKAVFRVVLRQPQPPAATTGDNNAANRCALWEASNEDLYNVFFTKGAACFVVRRFAGKTLGGESEHGQPA